MTRRSAMRETNGHRATQGRRTLFVSFLVALGGLHIGRGSLVLAVQFQVHRCKLLVCGSGIRPWRRAHTLSQAKATELLTQAKATEQASWEAVARKPGHRALYTQGAPAGPTLARVRIETNPATTRNCNQTARLSQRHQLRQACYVCHWQCTEVKAGRQSCDS